MLTYMYNLRTGQIKYTKADFSVSPKTLQGDWVLIQLTEDQLDSFIRDHIIHY